MINLDGPPPSRVKAATMNAGSHEHVVCAVSQSIMPLNIGGDAVPLAHGVVSTHAGPVPLSCHVQVAMPDCPCVVVEVLELVLVLELELVLVLELELLELVVGGGGVNSRVVEARTSVGLSESIVHTIAKTTRVPGGSAMSAVENGNVGFLIKSTTRVPAGSS